MLEYPQGVYISPTMDIIAQYQLISKTYGIPLFVLDHQGTLEVSYSLLAQSSELLFHFADFKQRALVVWTSNQHPMIISSELNQVWGGMPVKTDNASGKIIVIGPVFLSDASKNLIVDYAYSYDISERSRERLLTALNQTQVCSYIEFSRLIAMIYGLSWGEFLDPSTLSMVRLTTQEVLPFNELNWGDRTTAQNAGVGEVSIIFEKKLLDSLREGNLGKLKRLLMTSNYNNLPHYQPASRVRDHKNNFVGLLFMVTRMATEGGLRWALAYSLNEQYMQQVESLRDVESILNLTREMLYDYTARVGSLNLAVHFSKRVNDCCNFIYEHVDENLRVADIAEFSGFSANYISRRFKQETGQSLRDFIRNAKVDEAKTLLKLSSLSLAEISQHLSFSSQSFFTSTFHRMTGMTPLQYRERVDEENSHG